MAAFDPNAVAADTGTPYTPGTAYGLNQNQGEMPVTVSPGALGGIGGLGSNPPRGAMGPPTASTTPRNITMLELEQEFGSLPASTKIDIEKKLWAGGFYADSAGNQPKSQPNFGTPQAEAGAAQALFNASTQAYRTGQAVDTVIDQAAAADLGGQDILQRPGVTAHGPNQIISKSNPADVRQIAQNVYQTALGRAPTEDELNAAVAGIQKQEETAGQAKFSADELSAKQDFAAQQAQRDANFAEATGQNVGTGGTGGTMGMTPGGKGAWSIFQNGGDSAAVAFATSLLQGIGAPVSAANLQFVYDWEVSEGGGGKFNPLNQGPVPNHPELTTTGSQYGGGASDFASPDAGLQGAIAYLNMPNFAAIKNALIANNPGGAKSALIASPWASGHYNGGSGFSSKPIPANAAPAAPSPQDAGLAGLGTGAGTATGAVRTNTSATAAGLIYPFANMDPATQGKRTDQGWDMQTDAGTPVLAAGSGTISIQHDPKGFGTNYAVLMLDTPVNGVSAIYYGHASPTVPAGTRVTAGEQIAQTVKAGTNAGNASADGWLEVGVWGPSGPVGNGATMKNMLSNAAAFAGSGTGTSGSPDTFTAGTATDVTNAATPSAYLYTQATTGANLVPFGAHTILNGIGTINNMIKAQR